MTANAVSVLAPAKINLALHVTGQREDGYHLIDTLVGFGPPHDRLTISVGNTLSLTVEGPEAAGVPADMDNLVLKAASILAGERGAAMVLEKSLPAASGIGGGSSDAAAAIRGLLAFWDEFDFATPSREALAPIAKGVLDLGADVPMCLLPYPLRARGIGERIEWVKSLPPLPAILLNPRIEVSTPQVFGSLKDKDNPGLPETLPEWDDVAAFCDWLGGQRNDLQPAAMSLHPEIGRTLDLLAGCEGALVSRMSGSGATCFAIFPDEAQCLAAGEKLHRDHPEYWLAGGWLGSKFDMAMPKVS